MNIGFDAKRLFYNFTGLGNYSRSLVRNMSALYPENAFHLYSPQIQENDRTQEFLDTQKYHLHSSDSFFKSYWRSVGLGKSLLNDQIEVYHGLSHELPFNFPSKIKSVVTIHDLIFEKYPNQYKWVDRQIYRKKFKHSCKIADTVIAISESTKQDLIKFYQVPEEKISVVYQSCNQIFYQKASEVEKDNIRQKYHLPSDYLLSVGSIIERKNLLNIVKAIHKIPADQQMPLVVVGKGKSYEKEVKAYIQTHQLEKLILFLPKIDFSDLPAIYQMANLFVYPSQYEGFGIPIIEALASETPVITSSVSSLPEAGGAHSHYVDPFSLEELKTALENLPGNDQQLDFMRKKGLIHLEKFHWQKVTREMMDLYKSLTL